MSIADLAEEANRYLKIGGRSIVVDSSPMGTRTHDSGGEYGETYRGLGDTTDMQEEKAEPWRSPSTASAQRIVPAR